MYSILFACLPVWFQMLQWNLNVLQVIYERVFLSKFVYQRNFVIYFTKLAGIDAHRLCFRCVVLWLGLLFISFITNLWIQSLFCVYLTSASAISILSNIVLHVISLKTLILSSVNVCCTDWINQISRLCYKIPTYPRNYQELSSSNNRKPVEITWNQRYVEFTNQHKLWFIN